MRVANERHPDQLLNWSGCRVSWVAREGGDVCRS